MKTVYTITRFDNGWTMDSKTGDSLKNYNAVFEDPDWIEDERVSRAASLTDLVWSTFNALLQTSDDGGIIVDFDEFGAVESTDDDVEPDSTQSSE